MTLQELVQLLQDVVVQTHCGPHDTLSYSVCLDEEGKPRVASIAITVCFSIHGADAAPPERGEERQGMKNETFRRFWDAYFDWKLVDGPEGFQGMNQQVPSSPKEDTPQVRPWTVLGQMNFVSTGQEEAHK